MTGNIPLRFLKALVLLVSIVVCHVLHVSVFSCVDGCLLLPFH